MSFQQGLSGLNATSKNLEVIGNNIANANTFGAKASRAEFSDAYAMALNGAGSNRVGIGVNLATVSQQFTQGNIRTTENPMDLAINGGGFFQLSDGRSPVSYSRNGQFKVDREGFVVNNAGLRLMGYMADTLGAIQPGQAVQMQLPTAGVAPQRTNELALEVNLDARQGTTRPAAAPFIDYNDPDTYNSATSVAVYDVLGNPVALTYFFQKTADGVWDVYATANGTPVAGTALAPAPITTITYPADGTAPTTPAAPVPFDVPSTTTTAGAVTQAIAGVLFDVSRSTQFATPFGVTSLVQDGYSAGQLIALAVEGNGIVMARYSNGQSRPAGQVELANFRNPQGLQPIGDNVWVRTFASGDPVSGVPGDGNIGVLQSGALEEPNIDLTAELVNMITAQRIYQANAQTIKTQDQVLQTLVNLR